MTQTAICCAGKSAAMIHTRRCLAEHGLQTTPTPERQTRHLLLDIPSFRPGLWTQTETEMLLSSLPPEVTLWGGHLNRSIQERFHTVDLLEDEEYLVQNAAITADCAMPMLAAHLTHDWSETPALIIGWGRIGKILSRRLAEQNCPVTIASTRAEKQAEIQYSGYGFLNTNEMAPQLSGFRIIVNTAPAAMLDENALSRCTDCVKMDLASVQGLAGSDVIRARALPGRLAPEASGQLIARTFLRLWKEDSQ